jgi:hypothetical protein
LYTSEYYSWDPFVNFDKFSNYSQYYWLPAGPLAVDVSATTVPLTDTFVVTRADNYYEFSGIAGENPILTLVRGGNYEFAVDQSPNLFWIQTEPGVNGVLSFAPNISSRTIFGVTDNGSSTGTIKFNVPLKNAQQFYYDLTPVPTTPTPGRVDLLATTLQFDQINQVYLSTFLEQYPDGIDGITDLNGRTIVFTTPISDPQDGGWLFQSPFDPLAEAAANNCQPGTFDYQSFDQHRCR